MALGMMPLWERRWGLIDDDDDCVGGERGSQPSIVKVFPAPVCPSVNIYKEEREGNGEMLGLVSVGGWYGQLVHQRKIS
jgi:hypothetical protein